MSVKGTRVRLPQARRAVTQPRAAGSGAPRPGVVVDPEGLFTFLVLRPLSDLFLWLWRLERRAEYLYRPQFDRWCRPALFSWAQAWQNSRRPDEHLPLVQETLLPDEEELTRAIIDELTKFTRENWLPGGAQRFGNTKTFGVLRGEFTVLPGLPANLARGLFAEPRSYPAWVRFSGPGPYAPPDIEDLGQCSVGIKVMGVPGSKLMDDELFTQDLILVSPASFVTPNIRENAKMQRWVRAKAPLGYAINPFDSHLLHMFMQLLYSPMHANPLEVQYYSNVPFLLGEDQAVEYSLRPRERPTTPIPARPAENYLRDAMVGSLAAGPKSFDFMVQLQTDSHLMPIEDATVKWPESLSPYIPVARLDLPAQRFTSDEQLAFADALRYNPWHSLPDHKPLGNSNRARKTMYWELAKLRQAMNDVQHMEPTGDEQFPDLAEGDTAVTTMSAAEDPGAVQVGPPPPFDAELAPALAAMAERGAVEFTLDAIPLLRQAPPPVPPPTDEDLRRGGAFEVSSRLVPGPAGAPDVPLLICRPAGPETAVAGLYYIHGGGMVLGDNRIGLPHMLDLAERFRMAVVSVEYRLAPETPHPGPVEDCYAGLAWTVSHADELGIDPARVVVAGGSAGGGLAAAVALLARDRGGPALAGQLLICPMLDDRNNTPSSWQMAGLGIWDHAANEVGWTALLGPARGGGDVSPYAAPARATDLSGLPPAFIDVGSAETFRDEDVAYATRIWQAGGVAELHVWPGGYHGFTVMVPEAALSRDAVAAQASWLRRLLGG